MQRKVRGFALRTVGQEVLQAIPGQAIPAKVEENGDILPDFLAREEMDAIILVALSTS